MFKNIDKTTHFKCAICLGVVKNPLLDTCGHIFCTKCIRRLLELNKNVIKCPLCRANNIIDDDEVTNISTSQ